MFGFFRKKHPPVTAASLISSKLAEINREDPSRAGTIFHMVFGAADVLHGMIEDSILPPEYKCDGVLFEAATYLIFRTDIEALENFPRSREATIRLLYLQSNWAFHEPFSLSEDECSALVQDRMDYYAQLARTGANAREVTNKVLWAINDTIKNRGVPRLDLESRFEITSALDSFVLHEVFSSWQAQVMRQLPKLARVL